VGPAAFRLLVSTNGGASFVDLMSYTVLVSGSAGPSTWIPNTYNPIYTRTVSVTDEVDLTDQVIFRFQNFEPLASLASGSTHIDNIVVTGVPIPAPGAIAVLGFAGLAVGRRRR
jgi:MYXO-CTERM domain-containing protein